MTSEDEGSDGSDCKLLPKLDSSTLEVEPFDGSTSLWDGSLTIPSIWSRGPMTMSSRQSLSSSDEGCGTGELAALGGIRLCRVFSFSFLSLSFLKYGGGEDETGLMYVKFSVEWEAIDDLWEAEPVSEDSLVRLRDFLSLSMSISVIIIFIPPLRRSTELPRSRKDRSEMVEAQSVILSESRCE